MKCCIGVPVRLAVIPSVGIKYLGLPGGGLDGSKWRSVGAEVHYIVYLVPLGEGSMDPTGCRLAPECTIYCIWCHFGRVRWIQLEVCWLRSVLYDVFGAAGDGLGWSKWMSNGFGYHKR